MNPESADKPLSFGAHILPRDYLASWDAQEQRNREMLSHALNLRDTIVFVGAGCSIPLGYPSWKDLSAGKAITTAQETIKASRQDDLKSRCESRLKNSKSASSSLAPTCGQLTSHLSLVLAKKCVSNVGAQVISEDG